MTARHEALMWTGVLAGGAAIATSRAALGDTITVWLCLYTIMGCFTYLRLPLPRIRAVALWLPALIMDRPEWIQRRRKR